ncbi:MAG TPA: Fic family protein [Candidatus Paceibacterota bacterium]|nr:Fic family protein [Verrucomicrobiota bacterium]HRY50780.1 Fic family protein [Candidatus Paceibacterota bacterium]
MMTLRQLAAEPPTIPTRVGWYLADLGEAKGKYELFTRQSPQKLKVLREHALIESAVSSNRIEGVEVDQSRVATLMFGKPALRDRDEEEVRGYRDALKLIHESGAKLPISEATIKKLHKLCRGDIWDAGRYKEKDVDIIQTYADGRSRVRFKSLAAQKTPTAVAEMVELWQRGIVEKWIHPLALVAALNLDFLCIHPFRDGNGRVSRLLFLLGCYHCGLEVGRYISLERIIEDNKERYYEVLEQSSQRWHDGKHDPWPTMNFLLFVLTQACKEFEERVGRFKSPRGEKTAMVEAAIQRQTGEFGVSDLQHECPGVGVDLIRKVLKRLRGSRVACLGRGHAAKWKILGN